MQNFIEWLESVARGQAMLKSYGKGQSPWGEPQEKLPHDLHRQVNMALQNDPNANLPPSQRTDNANANANVTNSDNHYAEVEKWYHRALTRGWHKIPADANGKMAIDLIANEFEEYAARYAKRGEQPPQNVHDDVLRRINSAETIKIIQQIRKRAAAA